MNHLPGGLYEKIIAEADLDALHALGPRANRRVLSPAEAGRRLARALHDYLVRALEDVPEKNRPALQLAICNRLVAAVVEALPEFGRAEDTLTSELLVAVGELPDDAVRPSVPLSESALFVNATRERRIETELQREIGSADDVDFLCPFLFWSGYRLVRDALVGLRARGGRLRVLTSIYCRMTQARVLDDLIAGGAEVRVSYETQSTRLHAKAWFFRRASGYSTALVGSSNLSHTALTSGLEWNVRLSQIENRATLDEFGHAFENLWNDPAFEPYDAPDFAGRMREDRPEDVLDHVFELRPYPFQREILDRLAFERSENARHRNLVVAATGTGKTVIAALDYKRLTKGSRPSLLFVAHRKEILKQARSTFRHALLDGGFGEMHVDGEVPREGRHVFASVQSLAQVDVRAWSPERYDVLIVDEFHHASEENRTYARLLEHLRPRELLGLTATPERTDGFDVRAWFEGGITAEIRLWDAIDRGLLVPFHYFALHDDVDLSEVAFRRGRYDTRALERIYDGNDARAGIVCRKLAEIVEDVGRMRALAFCAGVGHARYMTAAFERAGLAARTVTGDTPRDERARAIADLRAGKIRAIFTVDVFNEGVDIPEIDTILFLRPTESATLFTQQLGRGLRHAEGKRCLTVLDFVGHAHRSFRYDLRFRALTGSGRATLRRQVEEGFPLLPAGCAIELDRVSREVVIENLKQGIATTKKGLLAELRSLVAERPDGDITLSVFLRECEIEPGDLYRSGRSWTELRRAAGLPSPAASAGDEAMAHRLGGLIHVDDRDRIDVWLRLLDGEAPRDESESRLRLMLVATLLGGAAAADPAAALRDLRDRPAVAAELRELLLLLAARLDHASAPFAVRPDVPLRIHARYSRDEIMAAFALVRNGKLAAPQQGVVWDPASRCKLLLVTITKDERDYSPSTMYRDFAIAPDRFHWQSQNATRQDSVAGRRLLHHAAEDVTPLLFLRATKRDDRGVTSPYTFAGPLRLLAARGERPIDIEWRLDHEMPPTLFKLAAVAG